MSVDTAIVAYVLQAYEEAHPNALDAVEARLAMLDAGTYIPANDPQAGPVIQAAIARLQGAQQQAQFLINRLQTLAQQSTPVV